ncbi:Cysteine proteinase inhibitor 10 [Dichanthelium oligosanthes]|uniref:Cysteine proteinase inhibitor 10 n=1 Tax=Dichanthelium oligosanthes TaxID=888268 RepID=A0A1E5V155_9POAL|nr:Cysteine proteinase inhibitor 10 [Dichanthelium oligosanthes]
MVATSLLLLSLVAATAAADTVHYPPAAAAVGGRRDIKDVGSNKAVQSLGRFAVAEHNRRLRRNGGVGTGTDPVTVLLSFRAVAAAQEQVVSGVAYYLKVVARDRGGDRPFDAVVVVKAWLKSKELVSFTPSPNVCIRLVYVASRKVFKLDTAYTKQVMLRKKGDAMLMFQEMKQQGVKPNIITYSSVIATFCRIGRLDDAMDIFTQMIDQGVSPDEAVYHCLIQDLCAHGGLVIVKVLISEMMSAVYKNLLITIVKLEGFDDGLSLFAEMSREGVKPATIMYNIILDMLFKAGRAFAVK